MDGEFLFYACFSVGVHNQFVGGYIGRLNYMENHALLSLSLSPQLGIRGMTLWFGGREDVQWSAYQCDIQSYSDNPYLHKAVQDNQVTLMVLGLSWDYQSSPQIPCVGVSLYTKVTDNPRTIP